MKKIAALVAVGVLALSACGNSGPPKACLDAMNRADEVLLFTSKAADAIYRGNSADYQSWVSDMEHSGKRYAEAKQACKNS